MKLDNIVEESAGHLSCSEGVMERNEMRVLGETVDYHQNDIGAVRARQPSIKSMVTSLQARSGIGNGCRVPAGCACSCLAY